MYMAQARAQGRRRREGSGFVQLSFVQDLPTGETKEEGQIVSVLFDLDFAPVCVFSSSYFSIFFVRVLVLE